MAETYGTQCCFVSLLEAPASLLAVIWHDISRPPAAVHARTAPWSTFPGRWKTLLGLVFLQNVHNRRHCQCVTACCSLAFPLSLSLSFFLSFFLKLEHSHTSLFLRGSVTIHRWWVSDLNLLFSKPTFQAKLFKIIIQSIPKSCNNCNSNRES